MIRHAQMCLTAASVSGDDPTPTPGAQPVTLDLQLNGSPFRAGDPFNLSLAIVNNGPEIDANLFVALDLSALGVPDPYYFWPSWIHYPEGVDYESIALQTGSMAYPLLAFTWPSDAGAASGLGFIAAAVDPVSSNLISNLGLISFSFE